MFSLAAQPEWVLLVWSWQSLLLAALRNWHAAPQLNSRRFGSFFVVQNKGKTNLYFCFGSVS